MQISELLFEGVAGLPERARLVVGQGHVVLPARVPIAPLLRALLFFDGDPSDGAAALAAREGARAAALIRARDGSVWRLVRALRGGATLQRWEPASGRFETVSGNAAEIQPLLRAQLGLPSRANFESLFTLDEARLASLAPEAAPLPSLVSDPLPSPAADPLPPLASAAAAPPDEGEVRQQIERLEKELAAVERVEELQRRVDALQHELNAVERAAETVAAAEQRLEALRVELRRFDPIADLPDDPGELLEAWSAASARRDEGLRRIEADRAALNERVGEGPPPPLWKDWRFVAGIVVGVGALIAGGLGPLPIVALLNVPAFGLAAALGVRWIGRLQGVESAERLRALLDERERRVEEQWTAATAAVRDALARAEVQTPEALVDRLRERAEAREAVAAAEEALASARAAHGPLLGRGDALRQKLRALETELSAAAAGAWRPREVVQRELEALRSGATGGPARAAPAEIGLGASPFAEDPLPGFRDVRPVGFGAPATPPARPPTDPCLRLLDHGAELTGVPVHEIGGRLAPRVGELLATLSGGRLREVAISATGGLRCSGAAGASPFTALDPADRVIVWIALQLAVVEMVTALRPVPLVWDDPLVGRPEALRRSVAPLLRALGARTQVIHRTRAAEFVEAADAVVEAA